MQTKSNIQLVREALAIRESFRKELQSFMDKWMIMDSYFEINSGAPKEHEKGYFVFEHEYNTFDEAISNMSLDQTIRIIENKRFQIGKVYEKISEAEGDRVIDVTTGQEINHD